MSAFFYDSYAFIEYFRGNPLFKSYFEEHQGITSIFNAAEVYYSLLLDKGKLAADELLPTIWSYVVDADGAVIQKAMLFRLIYKKRKLSYADCMGYELARTHDAKFLTGDIQFKDIQNVEFVK